MKYFTGKEGQPVHPIEPIFPILTGDPKTKAYRFLETGFFINVFGGFLTAKHVLYDNDGNQINPFFAIITQEGKHYTRYLDKSFPHPTADICFGLLRQDALLGNEYMNVDFRNLFCRF